MIITAESLILSIELDSAKPQVGEAHPYRIFKRNTTFLEVM